MNEAAIIAARHKGTSVTQKDLDKAIERVIAGEGFSHGTKLSL